MFEAILTRRKSESEPIIGFPLSHYGRSLTDKRTNQLSAELVGAVAR